jgi:peptidoglycan/LPS O-acetylase OafA/YrhL
MNTNEFFQIIGPYPLVVLWSLAVEEQFYLVWPLIVYWCNDRLLMRLALLLLLAAPGVRYIATVGMPGRWQIYSSTLCRMDLLAAGALISILWCNQRKMSERFGFYGLVLTAAMALPLTILSRHSWFRPTSNTVVANVWLYEMILVAYAGLLLWALSGRAVQFLQFWPLTYLGRISYTFYLVHTASLILIRRHVHHYLIGNGYAFAAALLFSVLSWHLVERPILNMGRLSIVGGKECPIAA